MQWFTRECESGGLSDQEFNSRYENYRTHIESIEYLLSDGAELLLPDSLNLRSAVCKSWSFDDSTFLLGLIVGDLQEGYELATIKYYNAELFPHTAITYMESLSIECREVGKDELAINSDSYEQRFLLWPEGQFGVKFTSCDVDRKPAEPTDRHPN